MSEYKKMSKAEMARLMLEGKTLEFEHGEAWFEENGIDYNGDHAPFLFKAYDDEELQKLVNCWHELCRVKEEPKTRPMTSLEAMEFLQDASDGLGAGNGVVIISHKSYSACFHWTSIQEDSPMEEYQWAILKNGKVGEWNDFPEVSDGNT